ncbi:MAG TPA: hypothetical protein VIR79_06010, partial [Nitrospira sp.]
GEEPQQLKAIEQLLGHAVPLAPDSKHPAFGRPSAGRSHQGRGGAHGRSHQPRGRRVPHVEGSSPAT